MNILKTILVLALLLFAIASAADDTKNLRNCKAFCEHCGCSGFYCGEECICECNDRENSKARECLSNVLINAQKLKVPFEILIQGPKESTFLREASEFAKTGLRPKENCCSQKIPWLDSEREKRSTVVIYKPPNPSEQAYNTLQQKIIEATKANKFLDKREIDGFNVFKPWFKTLSEQPIQLFRPVRWIGGTGNVNNILPIEKLANPTTTTSTTTTTTTTEHPFKISNPFQFPAIGKAPVQKRSSLTDIASWKNLNFLKDVFGNCNGRCNDVDICKSADSFQNSVQNMKHEWDKLLSCVNDTVDKSSCGWTNFNKQRFLRSLEKAPFMECLTNMFPKLKICDLIDNNFWETGKLNGGFTS